jgi:hypothetical protein
MLYPISNLDLIKRHLEEREMQRQSVINRQRRLLQESEGTPMGNSLKQKYPTAYYAAAQFDPSETPGMQHEQGYPFFPNTQEATNVGEPEPMESSNIWKQALDDRSPLGQLLREYTSPAPEPGGGYPGYRSIDDLIQQHRFKGRIS